MVHLVKMCRRSKRSDLGSNAGLPDGLFSNQKYQFGYILVEGLRMENASTFYGHLEYFFGHLVYVMAIW
jgi:hypothetical protein